MSSVTRSIVNVSIFGAIVNAHYKICGNAPAKWQSSKMKQYFCIAQEIFSQFVSACSCFKMPSNISRRHAISVTFGT